MGIRYYAYAFDSELAEQAVSDPDSILSDDPLADAWGLVPHATVSTNVTFTQSIPERDMLYLDKAWYLLQQVTGPRGNGGARRPAYGMFEGAVTMHELGWDRWVRTLLPEATAQIALDLESLSDAEVRDSLQRGGGSLGFRDDDADYVLSYLERARVFMSALAAEGRGMVYTIG